MRIHDIEGFPNPARVRMALAEKGASERVEFVAVDVMGGEHRGEAFRARNPDATVPCAELADGTHIGRCTAIIEYIDGAFDGPSLIGDTPRQRALTQMMNLRAEEGLVDAVGAWFHHATEGLGPQLETDQLPEYGERGYRKAQATMRYLDTVLADQPFVAGDIFTMADITAFAGLAFADFAKVEIPADLAHLRAWRTRVAQRYSES
jgi:glutathione S-transferase